MTALLIVGAGGHGKVVAETAIATGQFQTIGWLDDAPSQSTVLGFPVLGAIAKFQDTDLQQRYPQAIVAIGNPKLRLQWLRQLQVQGYKIPTLVHPQSVVSPSATLGLGSVVFAQAAINAEAHLGMGCIVNTGATVDHDCQLGAGVHCCPGSHLAGEVQVGERSWIGIGAAVIQQISIGSDVTIGAGAAVIRNLPDGVTAVGVPARVLSPVSPC
ncbi:acetyltransferase [Synechococcus elongatus]|uniref:Acetyltransferase n=1 Tax=Synechococcus elongatus PCC 11802 TaxID=2283154 RepID=A0AAT9K4W8_SYNEL|nr:acetyltransferase [Synechococcus elongatus]QFZ91320.1 acetyltransferase [Synechococcus elongatus PCC 11802]